MITELLSAHPAYFAGATVLLAGLLDIVFGDPPNAVHPVAWMGKLIGFFEKRRPRGRRAAELLRGVLTVLVTCALVGGVAWLARWGLGKLPWWLALPVGACLLKSTFSLRGLVEAGRTLQRALETDTDAAREELKALVSRSRNLDPPQIVSATVESLAENLTDSVLAPLLAFALFGLPGAAVYRAINTMDAMIGYHGEYEYFGKVAARLDDVVNWLPARIAGVILCLIALPGGGFTRAVTALAREHNAVESPNAAWTMSPMAAALRVQLEKVGHYRLGIAERPLTAGTHRRSIPAGLGVRGRLSRAGQRVGGGDGRTIMVIETRPAFFRAIIPSTHGGVDAQALRRLGIAPEAVIDFSANQSPLGPSPRVAEALAHAMVEQYPDRDALPLAHSIARHHGLSPAQVVVGNGSTELIRLIAQLALCPEDVAFACTPTFGEYAVATHLAGGRLVGYEVAPGQCFDPELFTEELTSRQPRICWLCSPNNPTGLAPAPEVIAMLVTRHQQTLFVLDEAYVDLLPAPQWTPELLAQGNLIVLRSMTKAWGLAGLGWALSWALKH